MPEYIKHLVECNCILKQFEDYNPPIFHKFIVFSVINDDGSIKPSFAKCNNCAGIHRVTEVNKSEKLKRESAPTIPTIEEIKTNLPEKFVNILSTFNLELPTWQEIRFVYDHEKWGRAIILQKEEENGERFGKYLLLAGKTLWSIDSFSTEDI